jgi:hypothetical protein
LIFNACASLSHLHLLSVFFSTTGLIIANDRSRLDLDRANELVFLNDGLLDIDHYSQALVNAT